MKTIKLLFAVSLLFSITTTAQITKGNWMVGGSGSFSSNNEYSKNSNDELKSQTFNINTNIGYFFINKLSMGVKIDYQSRKVEYIDGYDFNNYSFGPFARYYFLKTDKNINLFLESSYLFQTFDDMTFKNNSRIFYLAAGPTIYFNSSVGIEFLIGYTNIKFSELDNGVKKIQIGIGFQIYLEKNN